VQLIQVVTYSKEEDMLHARFLEHYELFDIFVVVESALTFSGKPKELHFQKQVCKRFAPFTPKVVHVVMNNTEALLAMAGSAEREQASRVRAACDFFPFGHLAKSGTPVEGSCCLSLQRFAYKPSPHDALHGVGFGACMQELAVCTRGP
jgi:hypothetical protein